MELTKRSPRTAWKSSPVPWRTPELTSIPTKLRLRCSRSEIRYRKARFLPMRSGFGKTIEAGLLLRSDGPSESEARS